MFKPNFNLTKFKVTNMKIIQKIYPGVSTIHVAGLKILLEIKLVFITEQS